MQILNSLSPWAIFAMGVLALWLAARRIEVVERRKGGYWKFQFRKTGDR